ncbi:MAG: hypothetical protein V3U87_03080 [Methylococcaceae bacterium]
MKKGDFNVTLFDQFRFRSRFKGYSDDGTLISKVIFYRKGFSSDDSEE